MNTNNKKNTTNEIASEQPTFTYHRVGYYYLPDLVIPEQQRATLLQ